MSHHPPMKMLPCRLPLTREKKNGDGGVYMYRCINREKRNHFHLTEVEAILILFKSHRYKNTDCTCKDVCIHSYLELPRLLLRI